MQWIRVLQSQSNLLHAVRIACAGLSCNFSSSVPSSLWHRRFHAGWPVVDGATAWVFRRSYGAPVYHAGHAPSIAWQTVLVPCGCSFDETLYSCASNRSDRISATLSSCDRYIVQTWVGFREPTSDIPLTGSQCAGWKRGTDEFKIPIRAKDQTMILKGEWTDVYQIKGVHRTTISGTAQLWLSFGIRVAESNGDVSILIGSCEKKQFMRMRSKNEWMKWMNEWMKVQWFKVHSKAKSRLSLTHLYQYNRWA